MLVRSLPCRVALAAAPLLVVACGGATFVTESASGDGGSGDSGAARDDASASGARSKSDAGDAGLTVRDAPASDARGEGGTADGAAGDGGEGGGDGGHAGDAGERRDGGAADDAGHDAGHDAANGPTCPAAAPSGNCSDKDEACAYGTTYCVCAAGNPPKASPTWQCTTNPTGCPTTPPALTSACSPDGLACDYGGCSGGEDVNCFGGIWVLKAVVCPG